MKKVLIKTFVVFALIVSITSCTKNLDIEPKQSIDLTTAFKTEEELEQGLIGCYSILGGGSLYGTNLIMLPELIAADGNAEWWGTFTSFGDVTDKQMTPSNAEATRTWAAAYQAINMANVIRDVLTGANGATIVPDADDRNAYIGEAEFIRGLMLFELVRYYGKQYDATTLSSLGVPIRLQGAIDEAAASEKPVRKTVAEVYAQVITDLTSAYNKLPNDNGVRADKYVARAILARVYLQQSNYPQALASANDVIQNGGYFLPGNDLKAPFTSKNTKENVFEIQQNDQNNAGTSNDGLATFYADTPDGIGRGDINVSSDLLDLYPVGDKRVDAWYYYGFQYGGLTTNKWISYGQNIPIVRIQEMYLIRAECNARLGSSVGQSPTNDLALINNPNRTGMPIIINPTVNDIILQKTLELAHEGFAIHELKRLRRPTGSFAWNADELTFPIPQRERDASQNSLVQNPGY